MSEMVPREPVWLVCCRLLHRVTKETSLFTYHRTAKGKSTFTIYQAIFMVEIRVSRFRLSWLNEIKAQRATKHKKLITFHQAISISVFVSGVLRRHCEAIVYANTGIVPSSRSKNK